MKRAERAFNDFFLRRRLARGGEGSNKSAAKKESNHGH
jgi:hypothetical protein